MDSPTFTNLKFKNLFVNRTFFFKLFSKKKNSSHLYKHFSMFFFSFSNQIPAPYVKQCYEGDPNLIECFISALHHLRPYLATGIDEIMLPTVEPFKMDELSLSLTTGPNGYKVTLSDMDIYGASNFTVSKMK